MEKHEVQTSHKSMRVVLPCFVGEASFCLWLLIRGVNVREWNESIGIFPSNRILSTDHVPH